MDLRIGRLKNQERIRKKWQWALGQKGIPNKLIPAALAQLQSAIEISLSSEHGRWVLGQHRLAKNEYELVVDSGKGSRDILLIGHLWMSMTSVGSLITKSSEPMNSEDLNDLFQ